MQIAAEIRSRHSKKRVQPSEMQLKFETKKEEPSIDEETLKKQHTTISKSVWQNRLKTREGDI